MKQGASHIPRKSKQPYEKLGFSRKQIEQAADLTTKYLKDWTDRELQNLVVNEKLPVCLPLGNRGFLIGRYKMLQINKECWRVIDNNDEHLNDFSRKLSAVFYCLTTQLNKLNLAREILVSDMKVSKLEVDQDYYVHTMRTSIKKQDYFRADLAQIRFLQTKHQLKFAIEELEKTINTAKYLKVQERLL